MTTITQHRKNIRAALRLINDTFKQHTGLTFTRIYRYTRIKWGEEWGYNLGEKDMLMIDQYLCDILGQYNRELRYDYRPALPLFTQQDYDAIDKMRSSSVFEAGVVGAVALLDANKGMK